MLNNYSNSRACRRSEMTQNLKNRYMQSRAEQNSGLQNSVCGCDSNEAKKLMAKLQSLDFAIYELVLYLDAYPQCTEALNMYQHLVGERRQVAEAYQSTVGPIDILGNKSSVSWDWTSGKFPWEYDAN